MEYAAYEQKSQSLKITTIMSFYIGVRVCVCVCVCVCVHVCVWRVYCALLFGNALLTIRTINVSRIMLAKNWKEN